MAIASSLEPEVAIADSACPSKRHTESTLCGVLPLGVWHSLKIVGVRACNKASRFDRAFGSEIFDPRWCPGK